MIAKFIGDTSRGFVKGETYDIKPNCRVINAKGKDMPCLCIYDSKNLSICLALPLIRDIILLMLILLSVKSISLQVKDKASPFLMQL